MKALRLEAKGTYLLDLYFDSIVKYGYCGISLISNGETIADFQLNGYKLELVDKRDTDEYGITERYLLKEERE